MASGTTKKFSWKWLDLGDRRLAWTLPARRPVTIVAAADSAKAFYPLPPEPPYRRHSPRTKNFAPEFIGAVDNICGMPPPPPPGGLALFEEACASRRRRIDRTRRGRSSRKPRPIAGNRRTLRLAAWRTVGADLAPTSIRFVPGDSVYLQQAFDDNYARWLVEDDAPGRRRRAICRSVALQIRDHARARRYGPSHARGSGPVRRQAGANRRDRSRSGYVRAAALSVARRNLSLGQVAKRHRGARILRPTGSARREMGQNGFT